MNACNLFQVLVLLAEFLTQLTCFSNLVLGGGISCRNECYVT